MMADTRSRFYDKAAIHAFEGTHVLMEPPTASVDISLSLSVEM